MISIANNHQFFITALVVASVVNPSVKAQSAQKYYDYYDKGFKIFGISSDSEKREGCLVKGY